MKIFSGIKKDKIPVETTEKGPEVNPDNLELPDRRTLKERLDRARKQQREQQQQ